MAFKFVISKKQIWGVARRLKKYRGTNKPFVVFTEMYPNTAEAAANFRLACEMNTWNNGNDRYDFKLLNEKQLLKLKEEEKPRPKRAPKPPPPPPKKIDVIALALADLYEYLEDHPMPEEFAELIQHIREESQ